MPHTAAWKEMTRKTLARTATIVGYGIVGVASFFVVFKIIQGGIFTTIAESGAVLALTIGIGSVLYAAAGLLLATAWVRLLKCCGQASSSTRSGLMIYARTQIAKYLPGNVFHLVSRHISGRAIGLDHTPMVFAAWLEALALVSAATVLAVLGFAAWKEPFGGTELLPLTILAIGLALAAPIGVAVLIPLLGRLTCLPPPGATTPTPTLVRGIAGPFLLYLLFFAVAGSVLWLQGLGLGETNTAVLPQVISIAAASWILGFLTPGAPAGIGVREALLIAGLSDGLGIGNAELIALAFRGCTLIGDLLLFAAGMAGRTAPIAAAGPSG